MECTVVECTRPIKCKGLCKYHYEKKRSLEPAYRECKAKSYAKWAKKNKEYLAAGQRQYMRSRADQREHRRKYLRAWATGFNAHLVDACRRLQGGRCAICPVIMVIGGKRPDSESADHEERVDGGRVKHKTEGATKHPRGLLCSACNQGLGLYENHQRARGLVIDCYEEYLANTPITRLALPGS